MVRQSFTMVSRSNEMRTESDRKETYSECKHCGTQVVEYVTVITERGTEYSAWVCVRCGKERKV